MSDARWYPWRALGIAAAWALPGIPAVLGYARCPLATLLHCPCPGCGMTRAVWSALSGDIGASFRLHPLALPVAMGTLGLAIFSVAATLRYGSPEEIWARRSGRALLGAFVFVHGATIVLWALRFAGLFGGPVPV